MKRRDFIGATVFSSSALLLSDIFLSGCNQKMIMPLTVPEGSPYTMKMLNDNIGIFNEKGGTIMWYMDTKGMAIIDTQFPEQAGHLLERLQSMTKINLDLLINTHHHGDHTAGNVVFKPLTSRIVAHVNSKLNQENAATEKGELHKVVLPNITFNDSYNQSVGKTSVSCKYFGPAHTNGDICIQFEDQNIVHIGDLVFNRRYPYIDKANGASISNWITVLDKIRQTYDNQTTFVWGHASDGYPVHGGQQELIAFQRYLSNLLQYGEKCIKEGKTIDETLATTKQIPGAEDWVGDGIERSLRAVYSELNP